MNLSSRKKLIAVLTNPQVQVRALTAAICLLAAAPVFAQAGGDPWTRAVQVLQQSFTTTIAAWLGLSRHRCRRAGLRLRGRRKQAPVGGNHLRLGHGSSRRQFPALA